jgi:DNA-binding NtrC family response regulator
MAAVLVIDDEWGIRETVRILMEHQGLTVVKAESGRIGLDASSSGRRTS